MSKLESAFSKALREQGAARAAAVNETDGKLSSEARSRSGEELQSSLQSKELSTDKSNAKHQIKNMPKGEMSPDHELMVRGLIYPRMADTDLLNTYRNLRTKLLSIAGTKKNFITLVTSVVDERDESLVAANLAAAFAFDESKTALLLDANMHKPIMSQVFDLVDKAGLMELLDSEQMSVKDVLCETGIPRLRIIPTGRVTENSAESFSSDRMKEVLNELMARYPERYPIIDAPSIQNSADARILLELCDQAILVIPYGKASEDDVRRAVELVGKEKLAGVVLNQF